MATIRIFALFSWLIVTITSYITIHKLVASELFEISSHSFMLYDYHELQI